MACEALEQLEQTNLKQHLDPDANCTETLENFDHFKEVILSVFYKGIAEGRRLQARKRDIELETKIALASFSFESMH